MSHNASIKHRILSFIFTIIIVEYHSNILMAEYYNSPVGQTLSAGFWGCLANFALSYFFMTTEHWYRVVRPAKGASYSGQETST